MIMERLKTRSYNTIYARDYFWRTYEKQEIDLIEDYDGTLHAFEFKWTDKKTPRIPKLFRETYPDSTYEVITKDNFLAIL